MKSVNTISWLVYIVLVALAISFNGSEHPFLSGGPFSIGKYLFWLAFLAFTSYSYYCSKYESLFSTVKVMSKRHWGRQIGIDLYIGLTMFLLLIFAHQDSTWVATLWVLPTLVFGNLAPLLYVALHYDTILAMIG